MPPNVITTMSGSTVRDLFVQARVPVEVVRARQAGRHLVVERGVDEIGVAEQTVEVRARTCRRRCRRRSAPPPGWRRSAARCPPVAVRSAGSSRRRLGRLDGPVAGHGLDGYGGAVGRRRPRSLPGSDRTAVVGERRHHLGGAGTDGHEHGERSQPADPVPVPADASARRRTGRRGGERHDRPMLRRGGLCGRGMYRVVGSATVPVNKDTQSTIHPEKGET